MKYLLVIEKLNDKYYAHAPDVPGYLVSGDSEKEARDTLVSELRIHFKGLKDKRLPLPTSESKAKYMYYGFLDALRE